MLFFVFTVFKNNIAFKTTISFKTTNLDFYGKAAFKCKILYQINFKKYVFN